MSLFATSGVRNSKELERIKALPRRVWHADAQEVTETVDLLSEYFRTPRGTETLRPIQAITLNELSTMPGLFGPQVVGAGKSLSTLLAPVVESAKRPLLLLPAKLLKKTEYEMDKYAKNWRIAWPDMLSYEKLSRVSPEERDGGYDLLHQMQPDLIICDEAHRLKNKKASVTRKVLRYAREFPSVKFVFLSGTIMSRSLKDFAHLLALSHKENSPLPLTWIEVENWAAAVDVKVNPGMRMRGGALWSLGKGGEGSVEDLRALVRDRILQTPGVVGSVSSSDDCAASLQIICHDVPMRQETEGAFETLLTTWETPDGHPIDDAPTIWRHQRELAAGFYYVWDPRPPRDWLAARKAWAAFVREVLSHSQTYTSEFHVASGVMQGRIPDPGKVYETWKGIRGTFRPNSVPRWLDPTFADWVASWAKKHKGLIFVEHRAIGRLLSERLDCPYFAKDGKDITGRYAGLLDETKPGEGPFLASIKSNLEGRNLQAWDRALVAAPPTTGRDWEQLLGRLHRSGQEADEVTFEVVVNCLQHEKAMLQSISDAKGQKELVGGEKKLMLADLILPELSAQTRGLWRWREVKEK